MENKERSAGEATALVLSPSGAVGRTARNACIRPMHDCRASVQNSSSRRDRL